jgi:hypothetical protein
MKRTHVIPNTTPSKRRICRELIDLTQIQAAGDERLITAAPTSEPSKGT